MGATVAAEQRAPKTCFVISPIGGARSAERRRADQVLRHIIGPVVGPMGYEPIRADHESAPGMITNHVIERIATAELIVADLTDHNPNVFYELALVHGLQRPGIQLIADGQDLPFDVAPARTIFYDINDLDSVEAARDSLKKFVLQLERLEAQGRPIETPVSVARDLRRMWETGESGDAEAAILREFAELRSELRAMGTAIRRLSRARRTATGNIGPPRVRSELLLPDQTDPADLTEAQVSELFRAFRRSREEPSHQDEDQEAEGDSDAD
jgi:hypothetical protein